MAKLHLVNVDGSFKVLVNGFCEMERDHHDYLIVLSFLHSLVEMCVITEEQRQQKAAKIRQIVGIE